MSSASSVFTFGANENLLSNSLIQPTALSAPSPSTNIPSTSPSTKNSAPSPSTNIPSPSPPIQKHCCGICIEVYKSPRILPCKHIFCRLCLTKLAKGETISTSDSEEKFACPLCREKINLPNGGVDTLPMYFDDDDDDDDDEDVDGVNEDVNQRAMCSVCEESVPAETECFLCHEVFCKACEKFHQRFLKHEVQAIKLNQEHEKCVKHPDIKVGYYCHDCDSALCKECVQSEHSIHQTQTLKSYLMETEDLLKEYSSTIQRKFEKVEMSMATFESNTEAKVLENIEQVKKLGEDFKTDLENACKEEKKKQNRDKTVLNRITSLEKKIKSIRKQKTFAHHLISEIRELMNKIETHRLFYLPNKVDDIISNQLGELDFQMGRLFTFNVEDGKNSKFLFFFGNLNWSLSVSSDKNNINLTTFTGPEDTRLIESITVHVTITVFKVQEQKTFLKKFIQTFQSLNDCLTFKELFFDRNQKLQVNDYDNDYRQATQCYSATSYNDVKPVSYNDVTPVSSNAATQKKYLVKVLFQHTNIKRRAQVE